MHYYVICGCQLVRIVVRKTEIFPVAEFIDCVFHTRCVDLATPEGADNGQPVCVAC